MNGRLTASYVIIIIILLYSLTPFTWLFVNAFNPEASITVSLPNEFTLAHFVKVFKGLSFQWLINSVIISVATATLTTILSVFAAYPFSRFRFPASNVILWVFMFLRSFPISTFMVPLYVFLAWLGLVDTYLGVIFALTILNLPLSLLLIKGFYDTVPIYYEEAAWVDGHGRWRAILGVLLPISVPGVAVVWITSFFGSWGNFLIPFILLRSPQLYPLSVGLFSAWGVYGTIDFGLLSALSIIYMLPPAIIYLYGRRWLLRGMAGLTLR